MITNEKTTFDTEYLANSEEFIAINNLLNEAFSKKGLTFNKLLDLEVNNEELFFSFSKKVLEETNFSELMKTGSVIDLIESKPMSTNKTITAYQRQMLTRRYATANVINAIDLSRFGNDQRHAIVNMNHRVTEQMIFQQGVLAMQQQSSVSESYFNASLNLLHRLQRSAIR